MTANDKTIASNNFLFSAKKSRASYDLPEYYLIYFLLNDLLGFKNIGKFEKIAWSFPIDYNGKAFLIEFRKFGVGVFVQEIENDEPLAVEIVKKIKGAVKSARPYFDHLAKEAVKKSELNIVNNNQKLYQRFEYLLELYKEEQAKYIKNKNNVKTEHNTSEFGIITSYENIGYKFYQNANWLAISCIEAFFSWTEHLFIHLAVVAENLADGQAILNLIDAEWKIKFKAAISDTSKEAGKFYNELLIVRQQLRNFVAHGAFGKNGNAFSFHSATGAVPVLMSHNRQKNRFSLNGSLSFKEEDVITLIEEFVKFLWTGSLAPAMYYTQECALPTILTDSVNGKYAAVTLDMNIMKEYAYYLMGEIDNSANMDW